MQKIKKGDKVEIIAGKDKGQQGIVLRMINKQDRLVVESLNLVKKHRKAQQQGQQAVQAGIIEKEAPLHISNVMLVCPQCGASTRVGFHDNAEGRQVRVCKKCKQDIE